MTIFVKVSGNWETVTEVYLKLAGSWVSIKQVFVRNEAENNAGPYPLQPASYVLDYYQNVFFSPGNSPFLNEFVGPQFDLQAPNTPEDATFQFLPLGGSATFQVPFGCNTCRLLMRGQGGAGAGSVTNFAAGAGGGTSRFRSKAFTVTEFETFSWSVTASNTDTVSGNGADGATFSISWSGNSITTEGGKGGLANGNHGLGGILSGSGPVFLDPAQANDGDPGFTTGLGFGQGGSGNPSTGVEGGVIYYEDSSPPPGFSNQINPLDGSGGGGGYNMAGQQGSGYLFAMQFWRV